MSMQRRYQGYVSSRTRYLAWPCHQYKGCPLPKSIFPCGKRLKKQTFDQPRCFFFSSIRRKKLYIKEINYIFTVAKTKAEDNIISY